MARFPLIKVAGRTNRDIGLQHGLKLADRIHKTVGFYMDYFTGTLGISSGELREMSEKWEGEIRRFNPGFAEEIDAIAEASNVEKWKIYVLNSRTEVVFFHRIGKLGKSGALGGPQSSDNECTSLCFPRACLLGESWDFAQPLEDLAVLLHIIKEGDMEILVMTEPGILGKVGFNREGVGVVINLLLQSTNADLDTVGVPIHVLMRSILEKKSAKEAVEVVKSASRNTASCLMISECSGDTYAIEFAGTVLNIQTPDCFLGEFLVHTNHYLSCGLDKDRTGSKSSYARLERASKMAAEISVDETLPFEAQQAATLSAFKSILTDMTDREFPILREYQYNADMQFVNGTVCALIFDLQNRVMHITKGSPMTNAFEVVRLACLPPESLSSD